MKQLIWSNKEDAIEAANKHMLDIEEDVYVREIKYGLFSENREYMIHPEDELPFGKKANSIVYSCELPFSFAFSSKVKAEKMALRLLDELKHPIVIYKKTKNFIKDEMFHHYCYRLKLQSK